MTKRPLQEWADTYDNENRLWLDPVTKARVEAVAKRCGWEPVDMALQLLLNGLGVAESAPGHLMMTQLPYTPWDEFGVVETKPVLEITTHE